MPGGTGGGYTGGDGSTNTTHLRYSSFGGTQSGTGVAIIENSRSKAQFGYGGSSNSGAGGGGGWFGGDA